MGNKSFDSRKNLIKWYEYQMVEPKKEEEPVPPEDTAALDASEEAALREAMDSFSEEMLSGLSEELPTGFENAEETEEDRINRIMGVYGSAKQDNVDVLFKEHQE